MAWKWRVGNGLGSDFFRANVMRANVLSGLRWGLKEILSNFAA